jgi:hypothetical protein
MLQEGCECREREMEKWKQNWDEVFMDGVKKERGERGEKRGEREKKSAIKCLETEKDERFNIFLQLSSYVLKIKSK